jgi:hypothetical protein
VRETRAAALQNAEAVSRCATHPEDMNANLPLLSVELLAAVALMVVVGLKKKALSVRGRRTCVSCRHPLNDCQCRR